VLSRPHLLAPVPTRSVARKGRPLRGQGDRAHGNVPVPDWSISRSAGGSVRRAKRLVGRPSVLGLELVGSQGKLGKRPSESARDRVGGAPCGIASSFDLAESADAQSHGVGECLLAQVQIPPPQADSSADGDLRCRACRHFSSLGVRCPPDQELQFRYASAHGEAWHRRSPPLLGYTSRGDSEPLEQLRQRYVKCVGDPLGGWDRRRVPTSLDLTEVLRIHPRDAAGNCIQRLVSCFPSVADRVPELARKRVSASSSRQRWRPDRGS